MPILETKRLKIHSASRQEMENFIAAQREELLKAAYLQMLEGAIAHPTQWDWYAIWMIERADGTHIGELSFRGLDASGITEIGYGILSAYEGNGFATEAVQAAINWAESSGASCIEAEAEEDNAASRRVLEKCGFIETGEIGEEGPRFAYQCR